MDLNTADAFVPARDRADLAGLGEDCVPVAGGTWLYSEPQRGLRRLVDLTTLGWPPIEPWPDRLRLAATCTIAELDAFAAGAGWPAAPLFGRCCRAFLASFKIWNMATVGGNLCMSLPAGPMISICVALDGVCRIWTPRGGERAVPVLDFVRGPLDNALAPGEVLRAIDLPAAALARATAFRQISLSPHGRSATLLIGTRGPDDDFALTVTASTRRPVRLRFASLPDADKLAARLAEAIPETLWYDDIHGAPDWRAHVTRLFAEEIRDELADLPA